MDKLLVATLRILWTSISLVVIFPICSPDEQAVTPTPTPTPDVLMT
ncbi:MAG: hypothetical protein U0694_22060 [Anaerolineae bacterium]